MPLIGIGTPPNPPPAGQCAPSPLFLGEGEHSLARKGQGESQFRRGAYTVVLFICMYFVLLTLPRKTACPRQVCSSLLPHTSRSQGQQGQRRLVFLLHPIQDSCSSARQTAHQGAVILTFYHILRYNHPFPDTLRAQGFGNWQKKLFNFIHGLRKFLAKTGKCVFLVQFQSLILGALFDRSLPFFQHVLFMKYP